MKPITATDTPDIVRGLRWLIVFRAVFAMVLTLSSVIYCTVEKLSYVQQPFVALYCISGLLICLSIGYAAVLPWIRTKMLFAYVQLIADSFIITLIVYVTGSFESITTFLYLVGIIGSSMLLLRKGSMVIAACCSTEYAVLICLEYYGFLRPLTGHGDLAFLVDFPQVAYRVVIIAAACFAVALLSGVLALQAKRARLDLRVVEGHLKRVERMAAMGEMVAGMAHEIKNPLASISGAIQLMAEKTEPGSQNQRLMQIVLRETRRLSAIVTDFLLFAKPKGGMVQDIRLDLAIDEVVELFRRDPLCAGRIQVSTRLDSPVWVAMDPGHFKQVLWNLLKNSVEAIGDTGEIMIRLSMFRGERAYLTVEDTGCGISVDDRGGVFDPFFTTKPSGSGLGLSIVHKLIDSYDGMVDFESRPGKGTVFTLILKGHSSTKS
ncbi:MAG: GHKL domain-containing protein [Desulfobacteraceae bacterium]|nr:GHKL domain-containing protein [Desulfobacteraceae bacterium]